MSSGPAFDQLRSAVTNRHDYAREWKQRTGGKVVGYFCTYVPEEILYAAGVLPVRIMGNNESQTITDEYCSRSKWCPCSRNSLAEGLRGHYDYLDGVVMGVSCFHTQEVFAAWVKHIPVSFWHYLFIPGSIQSKSADQCLVGEFQEFKNAVEKWTGSVIGADALEKAIESYNKNRRLLRSLYDLRKSEPPRLAGADAMEAVLASQLMDKAEHNELLEKLIADLSDRDAGVDRGVRVMVLGSENNDIEILRAIESWGANVVIDDHCVGSRYFWNPVTDREDRLAAMADQFVARPPCPTKDFPERRRLAHVLSLAREFKVEAAVFLLQKFCEPHQFDIPSLEAGLGELKIPAVVLEIDPPVSLGQIRTRVEALLDMIRL